MATDIQTFFDIYVRPAPGTRLDRHGFAARYAAAALLVACSKADDHQDPQEARVIADILANTFELSQRTIDQILQLVESHAAEALSTVTDIVNEYYEARDKRKLLQHIWRVAYADGRIDVYEEKFVDRVAGMLGLADADVADARAIVAASAGQP